jgi:DNA-binding CsgD family transcriptional regulator
MFGVRREQGRLAELAPVARVLAGGADGSWAPGFAAILAALGMEGDARRELARIRAAGLEPLRQSLWLAALSYLTDASVAIGDAETAAVVYPELEPYRATNLQVGHLVACYGSADRYLGMLAATLGEWALAEEHFEAALALNRSLDATTWVAHTSVEYARMLLGRRTGDDRARASELLQDAAAVAERHGLHAVTAGIASLGENVDRAPSLPDGLTTREAEILSLVSQGLSNREIGRRLVISEHTAANHVRSILRKTGCANRTEAAAYAHRRGLVSA